MALSENTTVPSGGPGSWLEELHRTKVHGCKNQTEQKFMIGRIRQNKSSWLEELDRTKAHDWKNQTEQKLMIGRIRQNKSS